MICARADYRLLTGDHASTDEAADSALSLAQRLVEQWCQRQFELAERTESVVVECGQAVPKAYPVESVAEPAGAQVVDGLYLDSLTGNYITITYTGGYSEVDMPGEVRLAVAEIASRLLLPVDTRAVPAGVQSVSIIGQGYSGGMLGGLASIPPSIKNVLAKYRHVDARETTWR